VTLQGYVIVQRQITQKWYKTELYLQWQTNRKPYTIYQMVQFSMTLNDPNPDFKGTQLVDVEHLRNGTRQKVVTVEY